MNKIIGMIVLISTLIIPLLVNGYKEDYKQGELIVKFKESLEAYGITKDNYSIKSMHPLKINDRFRHSNLYLIETSDVEKTIELMKKDSRIEYVEPNYMVSIDIFPNDPYFNYTYALHNTGQNNGLVDADIDALEAWDMQTGSHNVIVAVIDTGVEYTHKDLEENIWSNLNEIPENGVDDDNNGFIDDIYGWDFFNKDNNPMDDRGHGTHCAGIIGAVGNNSIGVASVNWHVKIMPLKFLNSGGIGYVSDAILAIQYATIMGAKVMSNSWGGTGYSQALIDTIETANQAGIIFVVAAGNRGSDNDIYPLYPSSYNNANIISVAATDNNDLLAPFSSYGYTSVDIAAPGVNIYSTYLNNTYTYMSGTSMATPYVAGATTLFIAQYPYMYHLDVKDTILNTVDKIYGLWGKVSSNGRLNVYNALTNTIPPPCIENWTCTDWSVCNANKCYQETANVSTACGGLATGKYSCEGNWYAIPAWGIYSGDCTYTFDGNWSTFSSSLPNYANLSINYTKPTYVLNTSLWMIKNSGTDYTSGPQNISINSICWNQNPLQFKVVNYYYPSGEFHMLITYWDCWNGSNWYLLHTAGPHISDTGPFVYEEAMWWNIIVPGSKGKQTRTCTDLNTCRTNINKPIETQECIVDLCKGIICGNSTKLCPDGFIAKCENTCNSTTGVCSNCVPSCAGHDYKKIFKVNAGSDDAYEKNKRMYINNAVIYIGKQASTSYMGGFRFTNISLPKGTIIEDARLSLSYNRASASKTNIILYGEASDNALQFRTTSKNISNRIKTSANVKWNNLNKTSWGVYQTSPNISIIVQEIISRPNWKEGNSIVLLGYESSKCIWGAISYEGTSLDKGLYSAKLQIIVTGGIK